MEGQPRLCLHSATWCLCLRLQNLLETRDWLAPVQTEAVDVHHRANRSIPEHELVQPLPAFFVLGLPRQANGRPCADELVYLDGAHI